MLCVLLLEGCGASPKRVYRPNPPDPSVQTWSLKVAVVEFEDRSKEEGFQSGEIANNSAIPLVPYDVIQVKLNDTRFGRCLAAELKASRQYATVDYHESWERLADNYSSYDLIVVGHLLQDRMEHVQMKYGLSFLAMDLALLGLPIDSYSRKIDLGVGAFRPRQPDQLFWDHEIKASDSLIWTIYHGQSNDFRSLVAKARGYDPKDTDFCTTEILQQPFLSLRASLAVAIKEKVLSSGASNVSKR